MYTDIIRLIHSLRNSENRHDQVYKIGASAVKAKKLLTPMREGVKYYVLDFHFHDQTV